MVADSNGTYRFVLYGRSGSGKTCVLACLETEAAHPRELSCTRKPVDVPKPNGLKASWNPEEQIVAGLHAGQEWIEDARRALKRNELPKPNSPDFDSVTPRLDFKVSSEERGEFLVRTVDYSGELINPLDESVHGSTANALKAHLQEYDGFLLLAEIPRTDDDRDILSEEMIRLRQAFISLREQLNGESVVDVPVAVALTKWDRRSEIDFENFDCESDKLKQFLAEHQSHRSLVDAIRNALSDQPSEMDPRKITGNDLGGLSFGNCAVFPTSAFGRAATEGGLEVPSPGNHKPFGLVEPFVWLADCRDTLDARHLHREFSESQWMNWTPWPLNGLQRVSRKARKLKGRMPASTSAAKTVRQIAVKTAKFVLAITLMWLAMAICIAIAAYDGFQMLQFKSRLAAAENPQTDEDALVKTREWFDNYRRQWNGPVFSPTAERARLEMTKIDEKIEKRYWIPVEESTSYTEKAAAARKYLEKSPNGKHVSQCKEMVDNWQLRQKQQANDDWLAARNRQSAGVSEENELTSCLAAFQEGLPYPEVGSDAQRNRLRELRSETGQSLADLTARKDWEQFSTKYRVTVVAIDFGTASKLLAEREPKDDRWQALVDGFSNEVSKRTTTQVQRRLRDRQFEVALDTFQQGRDAIKHVETAIRPLFSKLADALLEGQREMNSIEQEILRQHDEYLYGKVKSRKDHSACGDYQKNAPLKSMQKYVSEYKKYLDTCQNELEIALSAKVYWDESYSNGNYHVLTVWIDDRIHFQKKPLPCTPGQLSGELTSKQGQFELPKGKLAESVKVRVKIIEDDNLIDGLIFWAGDDDAGSGAATIKRSELRAGKTINLRPSDGGKFENELRLKIASGLPTEPKLPSWNSQ